MKLENLEPKYRGVRTDPKSKICNEIVLAFYLKLLCLKFHIKVLCFKKVVQVILIELLKNQSWLLPILVKEGKLRRSLLIEGDRECVSGVFSMTQYTMVNKFRIKRNHGASPFHESMIINNNYKIYV